MAKTKKASGEIFYLKLPCFSKEKVIVYKKEER